MMMVMIVMMVMLVRYVVEMKTALLPQPCPRPHLLILPTRPTYAFRRPSASPPLPPASGPRTSLIHLAPYPLPLHRLAGRGWELQGRRAGKRHPPPCRPGQSTKNLCPRFRAEFWTALPGEIQGPPPPTPPPTHPVQSIVHLRVQNLFLKKAKGMSWNELECPGMSLVERKYDLDVFGRFFEI